MNKKRSLVVVIVLAMVFTLAACGGSTDTVSGDTASISSAQQQEVIDQLAKEAAAVPEPDTKTAAVAATSPESTSAGTVDKLIGEWADINDATRIVKITSNGTEYQYVDPDGTYSGTMADGILTIKISDAANDTATVFIDAKTGNLVTNYQGDIYEFTKVQKQ